MTSQSENTSQFVGTAPYFVVRNLVKSIRYYHEALGFNVPKLWGDPPDFAMPVRDGFIFMLKQADQGMSITRNRDQSGFWDAYVWIRDADALFSEFKENGALIEYEPRIQEGYGMKEFAVLDLYIADPKMEKGKLIRNSYIQD